MLLDSNFFVHTHHLNKPIVTKVASMKKFSLAMAAALSLLSIAGCAQYDIGKGKAPPPVITKG
jgi:hypothetical protein